MLLKGHYDPNQSLYPIHRLAAIDGYKSFYNIRIIKDMKSAKNVMFHVKHKSLPGVYVSRGTMIFFLVP